MENYNNQPIMASVSQINYLKRLGYTGSTNITAAQANDLIKQLTAQQQPNVAGSFGAKQPVQQPNYQVNAQMNQVKTITTKSGDEIQLSMQMVKEYIGVDLSPAEYSYFSSVCALYGLNPYVKDIYAIKYGNEPATFVIDYKVMQQAADNNPEFDGLKTGVLYIDPKGVPKERDGAYILPGEHLLGAWCDVYRKGRSHTNRVYALYDENKKTKKDGSVNTNWKDKPVFMITKVAKAQALREAFPNMFSNNTYTDDEMDIDEKPKFTADFNYNEQEVKDVQIEETASITPEVEQELKQESKPTKEEIFAKNLTGLKENPLNDKEINF